MTKLPLSAGPFAHKGSSVTRVMCLVMLALSPATFYGFYIYGWPAVFLFLITVISCVLFEALCLKLGKKPVKTFVIDGSAVLTGWLLAMTLPPWAPWWIGVVGAFLAIVIAKHVFGGIGQNLFNPAMVARVALLISFPLEMTRFVKPSPIFSDGAPGIRDSLDITLSNGAPFIDAISSASLLGHVKTELARNLPLQDALGPLYDIYDLAVGQTVGSMGETSALLLLGGGLFLLLARVISWHIPVSILATIAFLAEVMHTIKPDHFPSADVHVLAGASLIGAFFIATDLVTSPVSKSGQLVFGAGCGLLIYVIRTWGGYPEGMAFAVLLMNATTPLIDRYFRPRIYGRTRKGAPIQYRDMKEAD